MWLLGSERHGYGGGLVIFFFLLENQSTNTTPAVTTPIKIRICSHIVQGAYNLICLRQKHASSSKLCIARNLTLFRLKQGGTKTKDYRGICVTQ